MNPYRESDPEERAPWLMHWFARHWWKLLLLSLLVPPFGALGGHLLYKWKNRDQIEAAAKEAYKRETTGPCHEQLIAIGDDGARCPNKDHRMSALPNNRIYMMCSCPNHPP